MDEKQYLKCEKWYIFLLLITVGGFYGGYTYAQKGGIFCNAQTANIVLFGMALGKQDWGQVLYLLIQTILSALILTIALIMTAI